MKYLFTVLLGLISYISSATCSFELEESNCFLTALCDGAVSGQFNLAETTYTDLAGGYFILSDGSSSTTYNISDFPSFATEQELFDYVDTLKEGCVFDSPIEIVFPDDTLCVDVKNWPDSFKVYGPIDVNILNEPLEVVIEDTICVEIKNFPLDTTVLRAPYCLGGEVGYAVITFDNSGNIIYAEELPAEAVAGWCFPEQDTADFTKTVSLICSNQVSIRECNWYFNDTYVATEWLGANGVPVPAPLEFTQGKCDNSPAGVHYVCFESIATTKAGYQVSDCDPGDLNIGDPYCTTAAVTLNEGTVTGLQPIAGYTITFDGITAVNTYNYTLCTPYDGTTPNLPIIADIELNGAAGTVEGTDFYTCSGGGESLNIEIVGEIKVKEFCYLGAPSVYQDETGAVIDITGLTECAGDIPVDYEVKILYYCLNDQTDTFHVAFVDGVQQAGSILPTGATWGTCVPLPIDYEKTYTSICANGVTLKECRYYKDLVYSGSEFYGPTGTVQAPPIAFEQGGCSLAEYCVESQEWTYGLDNTGTSFSWTATYELVLSNGSVIQFEQTPTSSWTPQMQLWGTNIQQAADDAGLQWFVDTRYRIPSNPSSLAGGGGFPGPPSEAISNALTNMLWRYVNIQICPGEPVPVSATIIDSSIPAYIGRNLTTDGAVLGPKQKFWLCKAKGEEPIWYLEDGITLAAAGQIPNCYEPCGTLALTDAPPESECEFDSIDACDNQGTNDPNDRIPIIVRVGNCNGTQTIDFFQIVGGDALEEYIMIGTAVDCATGEALDVPPPVDDYVSISETQICIDGNTSAVKKTILTVSGIEIVTYFDETGDIPEPNTFEYGQCDCGVIDYFVVDGLTGTLRNREWEGTFTQSNGTTTSTTSFGRNIRENHDFTAVTSVDNTSTSVALNDTNNSASVSDLQVKEGYIYVSPENAGTYRYITNSEGYYAVELGQCCSDLELVSELGKPVGVNTEPTFTIPQGIHEFRIWNIDMGRSNSNWNLQRYTGGSWVNYNSILGISQEKPVEQCLKGYLCGDSYYQDDKATALPTDASLCKLSCTFEPSVAVTTQSISEIEVCADGVAAIKKSIVFSDGTTEVVYLVGGNTAITPTTIIAGSCTKTSECIKWRNKYIGIDNTGSNFAVDQTIEIRDVDNNVVGTFVATASGGNTEQLNKWIAGLQGFYPNALIEQRYAPSGGAGLPAPTTGVNFTQMAARYVQFTACDGDELPQTLYIIESGGVTTNQLMDTEVIFGDEVRGYICYECGQSPVLYYSDGATIPTSDVPPCYVTCSESFEEKIATFPTAQEIATAIVDEERDRTRLAYIEADNTNAVQQFTTDISGDPITAGTFGCVTVIQEHGTGAVYVTYDGTNPTSTNGETISVQYGNYVRTCGVDLSLFRAAGSSAASDYMIKAEVWK